MATNPTRIIAVANEKGGVGKTVTVVNLAAALTLEHQTVLVVDMDPQANATRGFGIDPAKLEKSVYDLIIDPTSVNGQKAVMATAWDGLDLLPSHVDLSGVEVEIVDRPGRENSLKNAMAQVTKPYDYILIDTPPSLSLLTVNVLAYAREVLVPCQTHPYAYDALEELFDTIDAIKEEINPNLSVCGIVPTFFDSRTRVSHLILEKLQQEARYQNLLFDTVIRTNTTIADSALLAKPVVFCRSSSYGARDYNALAEELIARK